MNRHESRRKAALVLKEASRRNRHALERNSVLRSLDVNMMEAFLARWKQPVPKLWGTGHDARLAVMHLARLQIAEMTVEEKQASVEWLEAHGYKLKSASDA